MKIDALNHNEPLVIAGGKASPAGTRLIKAVNDVRDRTGGTLGEYLLVESRTVAQLQAITPPGPAFGYCSNEVGGECAVYYAPAAAVWRRVDTNATIAD